MLASVETGIYTQAEIEHLQEHTFRGTDFKWYKYIYQDAPLVSAGRLLSGGTSKN